MSQIKKEATDQATDKKVFGPAMDDHDFESLMMGELNDALPPEGLLERLIEDIPEDVSFQWNEQDG